MCVFSNNHGIDWHIFAKSPSIPVRWDSPFNTDVTKSASRCEHVCSTFQCKKSSLTLGKAADEESYRTFHIVQGHETNPILRDTICRLEYSRLLLEGQAAPEYSRQPVFGQVVPKYSRLEYSRQPVDGQAMVVYSRQPLVGQAVPPSFTPPQTGFGVMWCSLARQATPSGKAHCSRPPSAGLR